MVKMKVDTELSTISVWTDGACKGNPGPAGTGAVITFRKGLQPTRCVERALFLGDATSNIAELSAILDALSYLRDEGLTHESIALFSDSQYALGVVFENWQAKKNCELIYELRQLVRLFPNLTYKHVPGHRHLRDNERADVLAGRAVEQQQAFFYDRRIEET